MVDWVIWKPFRIDDPLWGSSERANKANWKHVMIFDAIHEVIHHMSNVSANTYQAIIFLH